MTEVIDSILIGALATYLPFWIIDSMTQRVALAMGLSMISMLASYGRWREGKRGNEAGKTYRKESEWQNLSYPRQQSRISQNGVAAGPDRFIREHC